MTAAASCLLALAGDRLFGQSALFGITTRLQRFDSGNGQIIGVTRGVFQLHAGDMRDLGRLGCRRMRAWVVRLDTGRQHGNAHGRGSKKNGTQGHEGFYSLVLKGGGATE